MNFQCNKGTLVPLVTVITDAWTFNIHSFIFVWTGAWFHESKWTPKSGSLMEQLVGRNCDKILQNEIEELIQGYYTMASM